MNPCKCCGYLTLSDEPPGTFEICPICFWEDDDVQFKDPFFKGGANEEGLYEAKENFRKYKVSNLKFLKMIRNPKNSEIS